MGVEAARSALRGAPTAPRRATCSSPRPRRPTSTRPTPRSSTPRSGCRRRSAPTTWSAPCAPRRRLHAGRPPRRRWPSSRHPHRPAGRRRRVDRRRRGRGPAVRRRGCAHARASAAPTASGEFVDRWRAPGEAASKQWEERFGEHAYVPLVERGGDGGPEVRRPRRRRDRPRHRHRPAHPGRQRRPQEHRRPTRRRRRRPDRGWSATPAPPTACSCWPTCSTGPSPVRRSPLVQLADGVDVWLLRTTDAIAARRPSAPCARPIAATRDDLAYAQFLTWRGFLDREPPRRPEPDRPAAPPACAPMPGSTASSAVGTRTASCTCRRRGSAMGTGAIDRMEPAPMADVPATIATFTVDRLAYSLSPPVVAAVDRLRRRRPVPVRADRRRPGHRRHRRPGRDDVPPPVHHRRRPQLLLEGQASSRRGLRRSTDMASHGIRDRSPSSAWAARTSASTGTSPPTTCSIDVVVGGAGSAGHRPRRRRRVLARHDGLGPLRADAVPAAEDRPQAGHPRRELLRHRLARRSATPATPSPPAPTTSSWPSASRS